MASTSSDLPYYCRFCKGSFGKPESLKKHVQDTHTPAPSLLSNRFCPVCRLHCVTPGSYRDHLKYIHSQNSEGLYIIFKKKNDFYIWKDELQNRLDCKFVKLNIKQLSGTEKLSIYQCDGANESQESKKKIKSKIAVSSNDCQALLALIESTNTKEVKVEYWNTHKGHDVPFDEAEIESAIGSIQTSDTDTVDVSEDNESFNSTNEFHKSPTKSVTPTSKILTSTPLPNNKSTPKRSPVLSLASVACGKVMPKKTPVDIDKELTVTESSVFMNKEKLLYSSLKNKGLVPIAPKPKSDSVVSKPSISSTLESTNFKTISSSDGKTALNNSELSKNKNASDIAKQSVSNSTFSCPSKTIVRGGVNASAINGQIFLINQVQDNKDSGITLTPVGKGYPEKERGSSIPKRSKSIKEMITEKIKNDISKVNSASGIKRTKPLDDFSNPKKMKLSNSFDESPTKTMPIGKSSTPLSPLQTSINSSFNCGVPMTPNVFNTFPRGQTFIRINNTLIPVNSTTGSLLPIVSTQPSLVPFPPNQLNAPRLQSPLVLNQSFPSAGNISMGSSPSHLAINSPPSHLAINSPASNILTSAKSVPQKTPKVAPKGPTAITSIVQTNPSSIAPIHAAPIKSFFAVNPNLSSSNSLVSSAIPISTAKDHKPGSLVFESSGEVFVLEPVEEEVCSSTGSSTGLGHGSNSAKQVKNMTNRDDLENQHQMFSSDKQFKCAANATSPSKKKEGSSYQTKRVQLSSEDIEVTKKIKYYQLEMKYLATLQECKQLKIELARKELKSDSQEREHESIFKSKEAGDPVLEDVNCDALVQKKNKDIHSSNKKETPETVKINESSSLASTASVEDKSSTEFSEDMNIKIDSVVSLKAKIHEAENSLKALTSKNEMETMLDEILHENIAEESFVTSHEKIIEEMKNNSDSTNGNIISIPETTSLNKEISQATSDALAGVLQEDIHTNKEDFKQMDELVNEISDPKRKDSTNPIDSEKVESLKDLDKICNENTEKPSVDYTLIRHKLLCNLYEEIRVLNDENRLLYEELQNTREQDTVSGAGPDLQF